MRFAALILMLLIFKTLTGAEYKVPTTLLFSIAKTETKNIFYPYIISINSSQDLKRLKKVGINLKKGRVIDCYDLNTCVKATKLLIRAGITNIDLGSFQINYKYHKMPIRDYFDIRKSALYASSYIYSLAKKFKEWNWKILSMYHSATPAKNKKYSLRVNYYYSKLLNKSDYKLLKEYQRFYNLLNK
jgi:hypothetical protein